LDLVEVKPRGGVGEPNMPHAWADVGSVIRPINLPDEPASIIFKGELSARLCDPHPPQSQFELEFFIQQVYEDGQSIYYAGPDFPFIDENDIIEKWILDWNTADCSPDYDGDPVEDPNIKINHKLTEEFDENLLYFIGIRIRAGGKGDVKLEPVHLDYTAKLDKIIIEFPFCHGDEGSPEEVDDFSTSGGTSADDWLEWS
jgi:hypothetical protein